MKMKKMIYLAFALLLLSATSMKAQVAIGTENPDLNPRPGAILDLGQVSGNNLGLLLPKVRLTDAKLWTPLESREEDEVDGMLVYNDNTSTENGLDGQGAYVWYDKSWNKISSSAGVPDPNTGFTQPNPVEASICYGETATFYLDEATGGSGEITYNWQQSKDGTTDWEDAAEPRDAADYTTPVLTSNMYYRRQATCTTETITSEKAKAALLNSFGEVKGKSGFTYTTYSYPDHLGIWTENVKEAGFYRDTYGTQPMGERGYLYGWAAAFDACSDLGTGWTLPSESQWNAIKDYLTGTTAFACDVEFFTGNPTRAGGLRISNDGWSGWGVSGMWHGSTHDRMYFEIRDGVFLNWYSVPFDLALSVRCIKGN